MILSHKCARATVPHGESSYIPKLLRSIICNDAMMNSLLPIIDLVIIGNDEFIIAVIIGNTGIVIIGNNDVITDVIIGNNDLIITVIIRNNDVIMM